MSRILEINKAAHIGCMHLDRDGIVGFHQAVVPQLLLIVNGQGFVRNDKEEYYEVGVGDAVFWRKDEWHETKTTTGLTAIVIESEELNPELLMPLNK